MQKHMEANHPTRLFAGLALQSCIDLPELAQAPVPESPHYRIEHSALPLLPDNAPDARHEWLDATGHPTFELLRWAETTYLHIPHLAQARLDGTRQATVWIDPGASIEARHHVLLDHILPRLLTQDGELMVHAAAIGDRRQGVLMLLGDSGRGKSTLCAALVRCGSGLLGDDCVRLTSTAERVMAIPTYPSMRLWPDSLAAVYGDAAPATMPVAHYSDKRRLVASARADGACGAQVAAIVVLQAPAPDNRIRLARASSADAAIAVLRHCFALDPGDLGHARRQLAQVAAATRETPVYALDYPRDYACLPQVIDQLRRLHAAAAPGRDRP